MKKSTKALILAAVVMADSVLLWLTHLQSCRQFVGKWCHLKAELAGFSFSHSIRSLFQLFFLHMA